MRTDKRTGVMIGVTLAVALATASGVGRAKTVAKGEAAGAAAAERGAMIVQIGGCNHCHTPWMFDASLGMPVPDMKRMLSGHPADAPDPEGKVGKRDVGTVYAPNLTPDKDTGMGTWTEKMFVDAIKNGKHMGGNGRAILPPMPWMDLSALPETDLKALYAFLKSIPAVRNPVPAHKVPEPVYAVITENFEKLKKAMQARPAAKP